MSNPSLSIIIPSYNTKKLIINCLSSVFKQDKEKVNFEVIIVDNASTDDSVKAIKKNFPQVKVIVNQENLGYARANNQALKQAKGRYILFLNSDTLILDKAIKKSLDFMTNNPQIDILGCQLLNKDRTIQPSGGFFPHLKQVFYMMFFLDDLPLINNLLVVYQQTNINFWKKKQFLDWVTGAFLMVKKEVAVKIKGFDESFFMYGEEVDFCYRAKKKGFQVCFWPQAKVVHLKGKSSKNGFQRAVLGEYQGLQKFYQKHKPKWMLPVLIILLKIGAVLRVILFGILKRDRNKAKIYEKAFKLA